MAERVLTARGHTADCPGDSQEPCADPHSDYIDFFCDGCHTFAEPRILSDRTSIAWPSGWSEEQARTWRVEHDLTRPEAAPAEV